MVTSNSAFLPARFGLRVVGRERDLDGPRLALLHADELLFEAGDELARRRR